MGGPVTEPGEGGISVRLATRQGMTPAPQPGFGLMRDLNATTGGGEIRERTFEREGGKLQRRKERDGKLGKAAENLNRC